MIFIKLINTHAHPHTHDSTRDVAARHSRASPCVIRTRSARLIRDNIHYGHTWPGALLHLHCDHMRTHPRTAWQLHRSHCSWQITHCLHTYASWGALALDLDARTHARVHVCESGDIVHIFAHDSLRSSVCSCVCSAKRAMCEYVCAFVYWMCGAGAGACISTGTPRSHPERFANIFNLCAGACECVR